MFPPAAVGSFYLSLYRTSRYLGFGVIDHVMMIFSMYVYVCACFFVQEPIPLLEQASASLREQIARQEFSMSDMEGQLSERRRLRDAVADAGEKKLKARKVCVCVTISHTSYSHNQPVVINHQSQIVPQRNDTRSNSAYCCNVCCDLFRSFDVYV